MTATDWGSMSRAERDAAYNNSAAVSDSAEHVARWTAASAALRTARPEHLDIPYASGARTKWDLFPATEASAPCLVHIHGGYWQRNGREVFACVAEGVAQHGWSAALPGYTLAPEASVAAIVAELRLALDWLQNHGATYSIGGPIILSGWSAGGHLAALLLEHPVIAAGLAISGVYELGPIRDTYLKNCASRTRRCARCHRSVWRNQRGRSTSPMAPGNYRRWWAVAASCTPSARPCTFRAPLSPRPATITSRSSKHCAIPPAC